MSGTERDERRWERLIALLRENGRPFYAAKIEDSKSIWERERLARMYWHKLKIKRRKNDGKRSDRESAK